MLKYASLMLEAAKDQETDILRILEGK